MNSISPFYISPLGGSIACLNGYNGRIFRSCFANHCSYSSDLHSAKSDLNHLETKKKLLTGKQQAGFPPQRKTTLKWNADGSLSSIDMTRILRRLQNDDLTKCELTCDCDYSLNQSESK